MTRCDRESAAKAFVTQNRRWLPEDAEKVGFVFFKLRMSAAAPSQSSLAEVLRGMSGLDQRRVGIGDLHHAAPDGATLFFR